MRAAFLVPAQLLGSMVAGGLVDAMFPGSIGQTNTTLGPDTSVARGVFLEMIFTAQLVFVVFMLAAEKSRDTFLAPLGIGLTLFVVEIPGVSFESIYFLSSTYSRRNLRHWRLVESRPELRVCRRGHELPRISLDLLARAGHGSVAGGGILSAREALPLRRGQPWAGCAG